MAPKNIDETIKKLLDGYAKWCATVLNKEYKKIKQNKFKSEIERKETIENYTKSRHAYDFFLKIAAEPKKYLYSGKDILYTCLGNGESLYNHLSPILHHPFDRSNGHLIVRLSEAIAHHVNYGHNDFNGVWAYYDKSAVCDLEAEKIAKLNKTVQLWNANSFIAAIKDFAPTSVFAVNLYKKESR